MHRLDRASVPHICPAAPVTFGRLRISIRPMIPSADDTADRMCTVAASAAASILVLGSKFIAYVSPAASAAEAEVALHDRQRRYPDATHHCWAYRTGRPDPLCERSSDAGEPSGTAGRPILDALRKAGLENAVCVVTRYFGGTKLGTGGLARAYGDAAREAITAAPLATRTIVQELSLDFDHDRTGTVYRALEEFHLHLVPATYDARAHGHVLVPLSEVDRARTRLLELAPHGVDIAPGGVQIV